MKTTIHIGQHKTGTTSIQNFLQDNRKKLAKNGLYVPSSIAGHKHPSHFILNVYALADNRYSSMKENILANKGKAYISKLKTALPAEIARIYQHAARKRCNRVIWSNEGLYLLNTIAEYQRLADLFSQYSTEIEVVCCFRDVESYKASYVKQLKKQQIALSDDPDSYRYLKPNSWLFDYERKKKLLSEVFDECTYFSYDSVDNISKFMEAIGQPVGSVASYRLNETAYKPETMLQRIRKVLLP